MMLKVSAAIVLAFGISFCQAQDTSKAVPQKTIKPAVTNAAGVKPTAQKPVVPKPPVNKPYQAKPYQAKPANPYQTKPATKPYVPKPVVTTPGQPAVTTAPLQVAPTPISTDKSLGGQYQYIISKLYHYQQPMVAAFWKNVADTLNTQKAKLKDDATRLSTQAARLRELQADVNTKTQALAATNDHLESISMFGIIMSKTSYNLMMWGLVLGFGVVLVIVIFTTASSRSEAKYRTKLYDELTEEFQAYKAKANDKEKKMARELQTERNKVDELMGRA